MSDRRGPTIPATERARVAVVDKYEAEVAKVAAVTAERDGALARVADLERRLAAVGRQTASRGSVRSPRPGGARGGWAALRQCESGGNYANKSNPTYRGAYQFDRGTWRSVGGSGDPADASPAEQDMRAQMLYDRRGSSPWPRCGRYL